MKYAVRVRYNRFFYMLEIIAEEHHERKLHRSLFLKPVEINKQSIC